MGFGACDRRREPCSRLRTGHGLAAEERQDRLRCLVGDRQRLNRQLLLNLERLQALQVQQQLAVQSLSIANQAPQSILSLFRG